eukprot:jgi/Psemu1/68265/estExt_Genemark1.C_4710002
MKALGSIPVHRSSGEAGCLTAHSPRPVHVALLGCGRITKKPPLANLFQGEGKRDKETINKKSGAKQQERHKRLKTKHDSAKGKDTGHTMTVMEGNSRTQNGVEGNSKTHASLNEDEKEDSDVSDDSSIDVNNPYPTTGQDHNHIRLKTTNHNSANDKTHASLNEDDEEDSDVSDDSSIDD